MKEITVKKTYEITDAEWKAITTGFNEEFNREKTPQELIKYYSANFCGYSYHGIAKTENGLIAGFSSVMPFQYNDLEGSKFLTGLSGGTFVKKEFRNDIFVFSDIYKALRKACINDGMAAVLGVPNKNSFKYLVKLLGFTFLYNLPYYVLPVRISNVVKKIPKSLGIIYFAFVWLYVKLISIVSILYNPLEKKSRHSISYTPEAYNLRFNGSYTTVAYKEFSFTYRMYNEKNINTAYLFQFTQKGQRSHRALSKAVDFIIAKEKVDIIVFVGKLTLSQLLLIKTPETRQPQQLPLTIDVLLPETDSRYAAFKEPGNWSFGLMNFDVR